MGNWTPTLIYIIVKLFLTVLNVIKKTKRNKLFILAFNFLGNKLVVHVKSEGCDSPSKSPGYRCGKATIKVNGRDYSSNRRGHNVVVVSLSTGTVEFPSCWPGPWQGFFGQYILG